MSDVEDYPGPSRQPAKQGQDPRGRADEGMVKPPVSPGPKKGKSGKQKRSGFAVIQLSSESPLLGARLDEACPLMPRLAVPISWLVGDCA